MLAFILGPLMERALRQSLIMSRGDFTIFFQRPISVVALIAAAFLLLTTVLPHLKGRRPHLGVRG